MLTKKKRLPSNDKSISSKEYVQTFTEIKKHIFQAQTEAASTTNKALIKLYWAIGRIITERKEISSWGSYIIEHLANDMCRSFPGILGFSSRNIYRMQAFYEAYRISDTAVSEIESLPIFNLPWGHNVMLLQKLKDNKERIWYAQKSAEHGWSRSSLEIWIESDLYNREGKAVTNFYKTLPAPESNTAQQLLKDPYVFDFLTLQDKYIEQDIEQGLMNNVQKLLLEMGKGFALVGRQYHLEIDDKDYYIDLLFYHIKLKCYVVVELKAGEFDPRDTGQINFYLSAVDDLLRDQADKPTIGLVLCKTKKNFTAEYALRNISSPIGIAEFTTEIFKKLPQEFKSSLPSIEEIEAELEMHNLKDQEYSKTQQKKKK